MSSRTALDRLRGWASENMQSITANKIQPRTEGGNDRWELAMDVSGTMSFHARSGTHDTIEAAAADLIRQLEEIGEEIPE